MSELEGINLPKGEEEQEQFYDELAERVMENFRSAASFRSSLSVQGKTVDDWLSRLDYAYNKQHEPEELMARENMVSYFGLIQIKTNMTASYMRSKFINVENPPFNISPTPIVDLPEDKREQGLEKVKGDLLSRLIDFGLPAEAVVGANGFLIPQVSQFVEQMAKQAKDEIRKEESRIAAEATEKMKSLIKDQLVEGGFSNAMSEALFDIALYPVMVISYEQEAVTDYVWERNKYVKKTVVRPTFRRVDPRNAYFAPDSTNSQDGAFFIEVVKRSKAQLAGFIGNSKLGYFDDVIKDIIKDGDDGWLGVSLEVGEWLNDSLREDELHILRCQMLVSGADLADYGVSIKESEYYKYFNADIEVCDNRVIRCALTPHPKGERTYFSASYKRIAGQPYGVSVGMMIYDRQLSINRTQYSMMLNAHYAGGPAVEVNADAIENPWEVNLSPYTRFFTNPTRESGNQSSIRLHQVNLTFDRLFGHMTNEIRLADDECGLPSFLNGNAGLQGAGSTLGGLAMMTDNAVLGLEDCAFNIDEYFIRPAITLMYARNLLGNDDSVKADAKVVATGLLGLKAEVNKSKELAGLVPQVGQIAQTGVIPQQMYQDVVRDYLKTQGLDVERYMPNSGSTDIQPNNQMSSPAEGILDGRSR